MTFSSPNVAAIPPTMKVKNACGGEPSRVHSPGSRPLPQHDPKAGDRCRDEESEVDRSTRLHGPHARRLGARQQEIQRKDGRDGVGRAAFFQERCDAGADEVADAHRGEEHAPSQSMDPLALSGEAGDDASDDPHRPAGDMGKEKQVSTEVEPARCILVRPGSHPRRLRVV